MKQWQEEWLKLKNGWFNLDLREQRAIKIGGMVTGVFILYQLIWAPMLDRTEFLRKQLKSQEKTLVWMRETDKEIKQLEGQVYSKRIATSPVMLLSFLQDHINQTGLASQLTQLKQNSFDSVEIHFQKAEFDKLIQWLMLIIKDQPVSISQFSVTAEDSPGIVNADIVMSIKT